MAFVALGGSYSNLSQSQLARDSFERAYALRERASERERYRITAEYFVFVTGELEKANLVYEQWARAYPRDYKAFGRLARNRMSLGQLEQGVAPSLEALRLFPGAVSHSVNLMYLYVGLNRSRDARAVYERAIAQHPDHTRLHLARYAIAFFEGDAAEMLRQAQWATGRPGDEDVQLSFQSDTAGYFGRIAQGRELTQQAVAIAERNDQEEAAAMYLLNGALREAEVGNASEARHLVTLALQRSSSANAQTLAALAFARSGDTRRATALVDELARVLPRSTPVQDYWLPSIRAAMALVANKPAEAIDALRVASKYELGVPDPDSHMGGTLYPVYVRGEAYLKLHRPAEAVGEFQRLIDERGIALNFVLGALAHLQLGRAKAMSGDFGGARRAYADYFASWKDADPGIPILETARSEYDRLH
jgi:eukaryotic-like serine/threonine-protein kinase